MISISCQFETIGGKPQCVHCHYVWQGEGPPPVRDCPSSPGYQEMAALVGYDGEVTIGLGEMLRRWSLLGQPLRSDEEAAQSATACESCDMAGCLRLHRMATWQCPKAVTMAPAATPAGGKSEEDLKREAVEAMRESAKGFADVDPALVDKRLACCASCELLRWYGCGLLCTCSERWAKWRERVQSGDCEPFDG